jgi:16S rRNA U516 pseudouridylate synthase RsuA-like enzyme
MSERLQKVLAHAGVASRRAAERLILEGRITVNGAVVTELGTKVDPERDAIKVDGKRLAAAPAGRTYLALHKPRGVVTTLSDPEGRPTVKDYLRGIKARVYPVGRLDFASEGLLLLTDDGMLARDLMHPSRGVEKTYLVKVKGQPEPEV